MADLLLYGIIGEPADGLDAKTIAPRIRSATSPITLRINSPGGYVMEGLAIVAAIRECRVRVTAIVDGLAASMASVIASAADECLMAEASMLMVHNPWDVAIGDAPELRAAADKLDRIRDQLVAIYGKRTGIEAPELMRMLDAETWMDAAQAVELGFADGITPALKIAACAVGAFGFRHTPDQLKEPPVTTPSPVPPQDAVAVERTRISTIMALGTKHQIPVALTQSLIDRGLPLDQARASILDHLAAEGDRMNIGHSSPSSQHQTLDNPSTYQAAIKDALVSKISGKAAEGPAAEFQGMSVVDIARDFLSRSGVRDVHRIAPDKVVNSAMSREGSYRPGNGWGMGQGAITQTTSDFPDLVGAAAETYLIDRYRRQESQLKLLARKRIRANFLMNAGVQTSGFGMLDTVNEAGEYRNKTITTRKEGWKIATYGNMFNVSRQMLINDALGALADILTIMAGAAAETEATILAALINAPPLMSDGLPVFHAQHGNLAGAGAAPSIAGLDAGRLSMRKQKDLDGVGLIDANPKYLLVPVNLQTQAEVLVSTTVAPTTAAEVNPFAGKLEVVADPRIASATAWWLFADPDFSPALEYGYLEGHEAPYTESQDGWRVDGTEYKVRHDFGGGWMDHRFAWKNPGGA